MNVLVIEEREKVRERIIQRIEDQAVDCEYQCVTARELVDAEKTITPDVVLISDEIMPAMLEKICEKLRNIKPVKCCLLVTTQSGFVRDYLSDKLDCVIDLVSASDDFECILGNL